MDEDRFFLEQYHRVFEQRRQHTIHIWAIPTVVVTVATLATSKVDTGQLNVFTIRFLIVPLIFLLLGVIRISLRHNFFEEAYGFLLREMDRNRKPIKRLPYLGYELVFFKFRLS